MGLIDLRGKVWDWLNKDEKYGIDWFERKSMGLIDLRGKVWDWLI